MPPPRPGSHKDQVRAFEHIENALGVLERRLPSDRRIGAGAEPFSDFGADLHLVRDLGSLKRLRIGIHHVELDAIEPFLIHAADGVRSAAADADHFNARALARFFLQFVFEIVHLASPPV